MTLGAVLRCRLRLSMVSSTCAMTAPMTRPRRHSVATTPARVALAALVALASTLAAPLATSTSEPSGAFCGSQSLMLGLVEVDVRAYVDARSHMFSFRVDGTQVISPCRGIAYSYDAATGVGTIIKETRPACLTKVMKVVGDAPVTLEWRQETGVVYAAVGNVPLVGSIGIELQRCPGDAKALRLAPRARGVGAPPPRTTLGERQQPDAQAGGGDGEL